MMVEPTSEGYWIAHGEVHGRKLVAEGDTRAEAMTAWFTLGCDMMMNIVRSMLDEN